MSLCDGGLYNPGKEVSKVAGNLSQEHLLTAVDAAMKALEQETGFLATPSQVQAWLKEHKNINESARRISRCVRRL